MPNLRPLIPVLGLLLAVACGTTPRPSDDWDVEVAMDIGPDVGLGGCVLGDFRPDVPGDEIAAVATDGSVWVAGRVDGSWTSELVGRLPGEMIQCAAADLLPGSPGDEIVLVGSARGPEDSGGPGTSVLVHREDGAWRFRTFHADEKLVHAVAIGDVLPAEPGLEVVVAGYGGRAYVFRSDLAGVLRSVELGGRAKGAAVTGRGFTVALADGRLLDCDRDGEGFAVRERARSEAALARVAVEGERRLFCGNAGDLVLVDARGARTLHHDADRLRGAVLGDLDPRSPGEEFATTGYGGSVVVIHPAAGPDGTDRVVVAFHEDGHALHHLAAGPVGDLGPCLVTCGYRGRILVLRPAR
ncbi:MAG: hypothetical protein R3F20_05270 [Planctomycetota bacterium]